MKILILSQYFPPDVTAAAYRVSETARILKERGHDVVVITSTPHKGGHETLNASAFSPEEVIRVEVKPLSSYGVFAYLDQYLGFAFRALWMGLRLRKKFKYEVVWATSPPLFIVVASLLLQLLTGQPTVLDIRDLWPESAVGIGKVRRGSLMEWVGKWLEAIAYRHSSALTCVSQPMHGYIAEQTKRQVTVVYNGVAMANTDTMSMVGGVQPNGVVFCYAGNLGYAQGLGAVIDAFALALQRSEMGTARLDIVGTGVLESDLRGQVDRLGITEHVRFYGVKPKAEAMAIMAGSGVLLIPLVDSDAFEMTVPSKVFDCMSLGRPILAGIRGEGAEILAESKANIVVPPEDINAYAEAFVRMSAEWSIRSEMAGENVRTLRGRYTREVSVSVLEKALAAAIA